MLKHLLVPVDGSSLAESAVDYAKRLISTDGKMTIQMVVDLPEPLLTGAYPISGHMGATTSTTTPAPVIPATKEHFEAVKDDAETRAVNYIQQLIDRLKHEGYQAEMLIQSGDPAEMIIKTADDLDVDAIVMSTHGRTGVMRWLIGSVTQKVLGAVDRPVFVIPSPENN